MERCDSTTRRSLWGQPLAAKTGKNVAIRHRNWKKLTVNGKNVNDKIYMP